MSEILRFLTSQERTRKSPDRDYRIKTDHEISLSGSFSGSFRFNLGMSQRQLCLHAVIYQVNRITFVVR